MEVNTRWARELKACFYEVGKDWKVDSCFSFSVSWCFKTTRKYYTSKKLFFKEVLLYSHIFKNGHNPKPKQKNKRHLSLPPANFGLLESKNLKHVLQSHLQWNSPNRVQRNN